MVNFALPSKGFASFTPSKLRLASLYEAQSFLWLDDFFNSKFKIQDSKLTKTESSIELLSVFFYREVREFKEFSEFNEFNELSLISLYSLNSLNSLHSLISLFPFTFLTSNLQLLDMRVVTSGRAGCCLPCRSTPSE